MPGFAVTLSEEERWAVIRYIRHLAEEGEEGSWIPLQATSRATGAKHPERRQRG